MTGLSVQAADLGKRLELLRDVLPKLQRLAILANLGKPGVVLEARELKDAARPLGIEVIELDDLRGEDIAPAFPSIRGAPRPFMSLLTRC